MGTTERLVLDLPSHLVPACANRSGPARTRPKAQRSRSCFTTWYGPDGTKEPPIELASRVVAEGIADIDAGRFYDADEVHAELMAQIDALAAKRAK